MKVGNSLTADDRGVSPVIGVILMVAITVILAAVIGTFVLGLGDQIGDTSPTAQINTDITEEDSNNLNLTIEHGGGDSIDAGALTVIVSTDDDSREATGLFTERFSVGDTNSTQIGSTSNGGSETDVRVRVIHEPSDSVLVDQTTEIDEFDTLEDLNF